MGLLAVFTLACGLGYQTLPIFAGQEDQTLPESSEDSSTSYDPTNGERIYFTATNDAGERIEYRGGPNFGGMMMGSYLTCASCHGPAARGGIHIMHMQVMEAPDIRVEALSGEAGEHSGSDNHGGLEEYTLEDFRQAVVDGEHPDGESLSRDMPRWRMSDQDLGDLYEFLKSLP